uniref:Integrase core domain-containing protein n=1 Tax=Maylandia zebra TaxID=106582 RepID=A0A3P9B3S1_9CICH
MMHRLLSKLKAALNQQPLNLDYLEFLTRHELVLFESFSQQIGGLSEITEALQNVHHLVQCEINISSVAIIELETEVGLGPGHPKIVLERERLKNLLDIQLPVSCIAKCLGVSRRTIYRRMQEFDLSVRGTYSTMNDQELDNIISAIKNQMPNAGYRMVQGHLVSMGLRVQWWRMMASMHRVDAVGIFKRITELGCVVRRSYSVRGPLSLVHIDTNHKLIRCTLYFKSVLYLDAATNNRAKTAFSFFLRSAQLHGLPSRSRKPGHCTFHVCHKRNRESEFHIWKECPQSEVSLLMFFILLLTAWVDCCSSSDIDLKHEIPEIQISDVIHLFGVHYIFVPRLRADLVTFVGGWNNHPLRTEGGLTPEQLWCMGHLQELDEESNSTVVVPEVECPLDEETLEGLQRTINPLEHSESHGRDLYIQFLLQVSNQQ